MTQRTVPANSAPRPQTSAPNSVFAAGKKPRPPDVPIEKIVIRKNVPKPEPTRGGKARWADLIARMAPGDSVELPLHQASALYAACKKVGGKWSHRKLSATTGAVWRDA